MTEKQKQMCGSRKGKRGLPHNSRGILVQTHLGKLHGGVLNQDLDPHYATAVADTQCDAVHGRGTAAAGLTAELHADWARSFAR